MISHGHTARGAIQTNLIERLCKKGHEVHILVKQGADLSFEQIVKDQGAQCHIYATNSSRFQYHLSQVRTYVHQNVKLNPALYEKHLRRVNSKVTGVSNRLRNYIYSYTGNLVRRFKPFRVPFLALERGAYFSSNAIRLINNLQVDAVISTRPVDPMEVELLFAAQKLGVKRLMYILSWDNITSKGFFPVQADKYLTWGPIMNDELREYYGVIDDNVYTTGVTHFDVHAMIRDGQISTPINLMSDMGLSGDKPYLFFTMSASYYAPNEIDIIEDLARMTESGEFGSDMQLVIRPHMVNLMSDRSDTTWLTRLKQIESQRVKVDFPVAEDSLLTWYMKQDDMIRLSALINGAEVCLNSGSTIAIEAIYLDRPVILTSFDTEEWPFWQSAKRLKDYIHLKKLINTGACTVTQDLQSTYEAIHQYLKSPEKNKRERHMAVEMECHKNDGNATARFVDHVTDILKHESI